VIACILIPYFAVTIDRDNEPRNQTPPLLIARYKGGRGKTVGVSAEAEAAGVEVGMAVSRARALCPTAHIALFKPRRVQHVRESLQVALTKYSQWVEAERTSIQTAVFYVDLGKLRPSEGCAIAAQMIAQIRTLGFAVSVGLASGKFTAMVAANAAQVGEVKLVAPGDEACFLSPQPVTLLPLDRELTRRLELFGLYRIGQLTALPRNALIAQFGKPGGKLHRLASGEDQRRVARFTAPVTECAAQQFDPPVDNCLILQSVLNALSAGLTGRLVEQGLSCREVTLTIRLENGMELEVQKRPREPISSSAVLVRVIGNMLNQLTLNAAIVEAEIQLGRFTPTLPRQLSLFDTPETHDPHKALVALSERYGENLFYTVMVNPLQPYLPEWRFTLEKVEAA
jgi:DNA polymerase-4